MMQLSSTIIRRPDQPSPPTPLENWQSGLLFSQSPYPFLSVSRSRSAVQAAAPAGTQWQSHPSHDGSGNDDSEDVANDAFCLATRGQQDNAWLPLSFVL